MTCETIAPLLATGILPLIEADGGERPLLPEEAALLEAHLAACPACREVAATLAAAHRDIGAHAQEKARMEPLTPELRARTLAAVDEVLALEAPAKKAVVAATDAPDPARVEAVGKQIALACSYCHDRARRDDVVFCAGCLAPHHRECFESHGKCSLPGCGETRTVRPADAPERPPARPGRGRIVGFILAPLVLGGVAALTVSSSPSLSQRELTPAELDAWALGKDPTAKPAPTKVAPPPRGPIIDVDASGVPLRAALARIASDARTNVLLDPAVSEQVDVVLNRIPAREAVDVIARMTHCEVEELPGGVLYLSQPPKVTLQFTDANVRTVLQLLAAYSGKNIVLAPDVSGRVSVDMKELHWARGLDQIAGTLGLHAAHVGEDCVLVTRQPLPPEVLETFGLPATPPADPGPPIDVEAVEQDLTELCEAIGRRVGRNILVDPGVSERVTISLRDVPLAHALGALARLTRCQAEVRAGGIWLLSQPPKVTLQAADCPATQWYRLLARAGGRDVAIDGAAGGSVTLDLKQVHHLTAARLTGAALGHAIGERDNVLSVARRPGAPAHAGPLAVPPVDAAGAEIAAELTRLLEEQARLARETREAKSEADRARLTGALELKQAEVRALVAPPAVAPTVRPAPDRRAIGAALTALAQLAQGEPEQVIARHRAPETIQTVRAALEAVDALRASEPQAPELARWDAAAVTTDLRRSVELQVRVTVGNELLREMAEAIRDERYGDLRDAHARCQVVVAAMRRPGEMDVFRRNAEALDRRAQDLFERGTGLERVGARGRQLPVRALVVAEEGESLAVVGEGIVAEGEEIPDEAGGPPVRVVKITAGEVRLRLGEIEFVRELGQ